MKLSKKRKSIISTVAVIVLIALAVVGFFVYESKKPYKEKSEIGFAMGSVVTVKTFGSEADGVEKDVIEAAVACDKELSNKIGDSVISEINNGELVIPDGFTFEALVRTKEIYGKTDGRAALTVGALSGLWNFDSGKNTVPEENEIKKAVETVNDKNLVLNGDKNLDRNGYVSVSNGSVLDLGSIGKGFACDWIAEFLEESNVENAVVAVGGSIYAKGCTAKDKKIRVGVRNPFGNENEYFGYISTDNAFISTSGNYEKFFIKDGVRYHHLLDCTTGYPVEGDIVSVTVVCDCGYVSDALSTACFVMGYGEKTLSLLKDYSAEAIFVFEDGSVKMTNGIEKSFTLTDSSFKVTVV